MELTFKEKVLRVFMSKKGFVLYMVDKNAANIKTAAESAEKNYKETDLMVSEILKNKRDAEAKLLDARDRFDRVNITLEGKQAEWKAFKSDLSSIDMAKNDQFVRIIKELVEEETRAKISLESLQKTVDNYSERAVDMRRSFNSIKSRSEELNRQHQEIIERRLQIEMMQKAQLSLMLVESKKLKNSKNFVEGFLAITENNQKQIEENRPLTEEEKMVQSRMQEVLGESDRKAIQ